MVNAGLGLIAFEYAWWKVRRFRTPVAELDALVPAFRRNDVAKWRKWTFYPGALTLCLPRFVFAISIGFILSILLTLMLIGQAMNEPIRGCRRVIIRWTYKVLAFCFQLITNFNFVTWRRLSMDDVDYYQEWLGPREIQEKEQLEGDFVEIHDKNSTDFSDHNANPHSPLGLSPSGSQQMLAGPSREKRIPKRGRGPPSTVICNHIGWIDVMALIMSPLHPGFTPKDDFITTPLLGTACRGLQSLFIARGADLETKQRIVEQIKERQRLIEDECQEYNPICIFAEGTTTNGSALLKFKRGAFEGLRTVIPTYVTFGNHYFNPTYDTMPFWPLLIIYLSSFSMFNLKLTIMPEFTPTEWMLDNRKDKGLENWEIYAECVREAMAKQGGFTIDNHTVREKLAYEDFMEGVTDHITIDGQTFGYPDGRISMNDEY